MIDYRTTHYMLPTRHNKFKTTTTAFIKLHKSEQLKSLKLFPNDLVVAVFGNDEKTTLRRFYPAKLALYKYIWDNVDDSDKAIIRKHVKRCADVRKQFKSGKCSDAVKIWYMALVLGAADDV